MTVLVFKRTYQNDSNIQQPIYSTQIQTYTSQHWCFNAAVVARSRQQIFFLQRSSLKKLGFQYRKRSKQLKTHISLQWVFNLQIIFTVNAAQSPISTQICITLHNHRPIQQSQAQTHTQQFIIHVLVLETNMNSYIKLFSLQNMNSYIKNWAKDAPFSSCPVYFSATTNSRRKIGQK